MSADHVLDYDDIAPLEFRVKFKGKLYVLTEASAGAGVAYSNAKSRAVRMEMTPDGKPKITGMDGGAEADLCLLSACLFETDADGKVRWVQGPEPKPVQVPIHVLRTWPVRVTAPLTAKVKEISDGLRDGEDTAESLAKERELLAARQAAFDAGTTTGKDDSPTTPGTSE